MNKLLILIGSLFLIEFGLCQIPEPLAYYDFEDEEGDVVTDKGPLGNDGIKDAGISYGGGAGASNSNSPGNESPAQGIDGDGGTKYLNFARLNTGIIVTPQNSSIVTSISLDTANDAVERDPTSFILFGTNETIQSADNSVGNSEDWTEIESGDFNLPDSRNTPGTVINLDNDTEYESYKLIFPTVKGNGNSMQIAEIQFYTEEDGGGNPILSPFDAVIGIHAAADIPPFTGAPGGSSPNTAASFNNNKIDVPGIDLSFVISDEGSYTFTAWIKPSDLNGEKFIFGQTTQGIHNGIRNNSYLHQAHWGADTNGATNLNDYLANDEDGWIHAAWTYEGSTDTGKIYLDGVLDWEGAKRAPNGSGNLIIGGRNGGERGFVGLIDEIAVWDIAVTDEVIAGLAEGLSPIGSNTEDDDNDGLPDWWEEKYSVDDPDADPDNDGLSNSEELEALTNPKKTDTDDDGINDKAELLAKTNPLKSDTDNDGLSDGNELSIGTNPLISDTDGDGYADGVEINAGTNPTNSGSVPASLIAYYDFEDEEGDVVTDKGPLGNDGIKDAGISYGGGAGASNSNSPGNESPAQGIDGDGGTKYLNFARLNTGIIVTPQNSSIVTSISLDTANDAVERDPTSFILFGTNETIQSADNSVGNSEDWTEIESGDFNLPDSRNTPGTVINLDNDTEYESYKLIFPTVKGNGNSMQIAEIQFYTEEDGGGNPILSPFDAVIGIHAAADIPPFTGAPGGSSPNTAASFNNNKIDVPGIDLSFVISDEGSYTFTAWIKPSDLNGEKFIFGQTTQGIHNGIRNNSYLHQAHWGADTNGATNLNDYLANDEDGWIHAAWTYEGSTDTGKIYLDGVLDWEGAKRAPNGSGNLIIGGRNGGERGFVGLIDEIAVWDIAVTDEVIAGLAEGLSPIGSNLPFQITNITYVKETEELELTWDSKPGKTYSLFYNTALDEWESDIDDSIESEGDSTSYRFNNPEGTNAKKLFFRIIEN